VRPPPNGRPFRTCHHVTSAASSKVGLSSIAPPPPAGSDQCTVTPFSGLWLHPADSMSFVGRSGPAVSVAIPLVFLAFAVVVTGVAASRGACGDGDLRPSCGMFATGIVLYSLLAVGALTALTTLVLLLLRRKPPKLAVVSSGLFVAAVSSLLLPVLAVGNKLAGAVVVMLVLPFATLLVLAASICSLACLSQTINRNRTT